MMVMMMMMMMMMMMTTTTTTTTTTMMTKCAESFFNADLSTAERTALLFDVVRSREFSNAVLVELSTAKWTASSVSVVTQTSAGLQVL